MRKLTEGDVADRLIQTYGAVQRDISRGTRLKTKAQQADIPDTHRLDDGLEGAYDIPEENIARMVSARLAMQGFVCYHDENVARDNISKGLARLEGLISE